MFKKVLSLILVIAMMLSLCGCSDLAGGAFLALLAATGEDKADRSDIFGFVRMNEDALTEAIEKGDFSEFEDTGIIQDIDADETVVDFYCGGAGFGSATAYTGFYYTPKDDMTALWCAPSDGQLRPLGSGFEWREEGGDDRYYTEHICGNFYYYEASF